MFCLKTLKKERGEPLSFQTSNLTFAGIISSAGGICKRFFGGNAENFNIFSSF
jgi:hypothetical protein